MLNLAPRILPPPQIQYNKRRIKNETVVRFRLGHHNNSYSVASKPRPAGQWRKPASQNEHISAVMMNMEHRQLTLMFTDIVGYSRLMGRDETAAIELLGEYRRILLARIEEFQGTLIEFAGDAIFARFDCPVAAVQAAVAIQKDLGVFNRERDKTLPLLQSRIGIHAGEVALRDNAVFGDDVNIAARLEPIAVADGVCVSGEVYKAVKDVIHEPVLSLGKQTLKNIENRIKVYLIRPAGITLGTHAHYFWRTCQLKLGAYRYPIAASLLLLIAAGFYFVPRWLVPGYDANYVEIADFQNLMNDTREADYFSAGITEALRAQLADMRDVYILDADEGVRAPVRLEGNVQRVGDNLRIAYRLFRRKDNVQIAGGKLDGAYNDIFILQDRVVAEIAGYLAEEFGLRNFRPAALKLTSDVTAYDYYLQGLDYLNKPDSQDNLDAAIKMFSTALIHDTGFSLANTGLCRTFQEKYDITRTSSWLEKAEKYCSLALELDNSSSKNYEALGNVYESRGKLNEAIEALNKAIDYDPYNVDAIIGLANVHRIANASDLAEKEFKRAIVSQPNYWKSHQALANFYLGTGRLEAAIKEYRAVLDITPENVYAYSNLGIAYAYLGNFREAASTFSQSVKLSPNSLAFSNSGNMYYLAGDFGKASQMYREAIRMNPNDYRLYLNLADSLRQIPGKIDDARANYKKSLNLAQSAIKINSKDAQLYQYVALSYLFLDQKEKGLRALNHALTLNPDDVDIRYSALKFWAVMKDNQQIISAFHRLMETGYSPKLIEADPDLKGLAELPDYQNILVSDKG